MQVLVGVVIPEFALLEVQPECTFAHAPELDELGFSCVPEALDAGEVVMNPGQSIIAMVDTEIFVISPHPRDQRRF